MTAIIIYTKKEKLRHKKNLRNICSFWTLANYPKHFEPDEDRVYFAYDGFIQGYFESDVTPFYSRKIPDNAVVFHPRWYPLEKKIPQKQFQGFKYFKHEEKEESKKN